MKGGHYVYFNSSFQNYSFLTTHNFQTQMGREIVYNNEENKNFKKRCHQIKIFRKMQVAKHGI